MDESDSGKSDMSSLNDWDVVSSLDVKDNEENEFAEDAGSSNDLKNNTAHVGSHVEDVNDQALANDSSSDIDIIEESIESLEIDDSRDRIFLPTALSISSSVGFISESTSDESAQSSLVLRSEIKEDEAQNDSSPDGASEAASFMSYRFGGRSINDWIGFVWEYIQSLSGFQIGSILGLTFCIYFCITINQTNIIALQEKGNVVSQMERLVDELRHDNKHLQEKMLSEMKNDKLVSSFEHQIRELKKENSKLNHMLLDVVKVLEQQKENQEKLLTKRESDYQAPFKKEINKLKEHINMLKIDNEDLQKQLVRMRYSSYSQGSKHEHEKDRKEHKKPTRERPETKSENFERSENSEKDLNGEQKKHTEEEVIDELPLDILQLKRWNELLDQFVRESGLFEQEQEPTEKKGRWNWKEGLKNKFKKPADYVSKYAGKLFYSDLYKKMLKDVYKSASDYIADAQENVQSLFESQQDPAKSSDMKANIWNVINGLGEKWAEVKEKITSTYLFDEKECPAEREQSKESSFENDKQEHSGGSDPTRESEDSAAAGEKWFFKRAQLREKLRDNEKEDSINWFLRRRKSWFSEAVDDDDGVAGTKQE